MAKTDRQHLFVYGTLAPNQPNHHIMTPISGTWQRASAMGIYDKHGFGKTGGYPAFVPDEYLSNDLPDDFVLDSRSDVVQGLVFSSQNLQEHWQRLDEFEGAAYRRVQIFVTLQTGERVEAFVYALNVSQQATFAQTTLWSRH